MTVPGIPLRLRAESWLASRVSAERRPRAERWLRRLLQPAWPGTLRRTTPLSSLWGYDRGSPIDRYYIERFLGDHRADIHGRVLEIKDSTYTRQFATGVERSDVLDIDPTNRQATIHADLGAPGALVADQFDCFILTQTLQYLLDPRVAVAQAHQILRPGGVLLATVPAVSRVHMEHARSDDYWRFTPSACLALFGQVFQPHNVTVVGYGNVLVSIAFLMGMAREELSQLELDACDPAFPLTVAIRAVKEAEALPLNLVSTGL
jgi:SAM-dependent methyltransferase